MLGAASPAMSKVRAMENRRAATARGSAPDSSVVGCPRDAGGGGTSGAADISGGAAPSLPAGACLAAGAAAMAGGVTSTVSAPASEIAEIAAPAAPAVPTAPTAPTAPAALISAASLEELCIYRVGRRLRLPEAVMQHYDEQLRIKALFPWQYECVAVRGVLDGRNLVYSAPTSGGKSLVAELLMCRTLHRWRKKVLVVLPYVSLVEENRSRLR